MNKEIQKTVEPFDKMDNEGLSRDQIKQQDTWLADMKRRNVMAKHNTKFLKIINNKEKD